MPYMSVTCHPAEVTVPPLSQQNYKLGTRFSDSDGMQGGGPDAQGKGLVLGGLVAH